METRKKIDYEQLLGSQFSSTEGNTKENGDKSLRKYVLGVEYREH